MPTFLSDPAPAFYLILLGFAVVTGAIAARYQDRPSLIRFGIAIAVLLLAYLIDKSFESPREEAVRRVQAMAQAADAKNPDAFVEHLADSFEYRGGEKPTNAKKDEMRTAPFWDMLRQINARVTVWDFSRDDVKQVDANTIEIGFSGKGESDNRPMMLYMKATFRKQPDGQWKLTAIASFKFEKHDEALAIPNFPR